MIFEDYFFFIEIPHVVQGCCTVSYLVKDHSGQKIRDVWNATFQQTNIKMTKHQ